MGYKIPAEVENVLLFYYSKIVYTNGPLKGLFYLTDFVKLWFNDKKYANYIRQKERVSG